jgi:hypothetical protein
MIVKMAADTVTAARSPLPVRNSYSAMMSIFQVVRLLARQALRRCVRVNPGTHGI